MPIGKGSLFSLRAVGGIGKARKRKIRIVPVAPPVPPPEEYTEEQTEHNSDVKLYAGSYTRVGQKLTIANRRVTKLAFYMKRYVNPNDVLTFEIRAVDDGELLASKVWGDAIDLPTELEWIEVTFDAPVLINEEVRICAYYDHGTASHYVIMRYQSTDVKADEMLTLSTALPDWDDHATLDTAYRYKYYLP